MKKIISFFAVLFISQAQAACPDENRPVCAVDGNTYANACLAAQASVAIFRQGKCEDFDERISALPDISTCSNDLDPVCGADGVTYSNPCRADASGQVIHRKGRCEDLLATINNPPQTCPPDEAPVCAANGQNYSNGCTAQMQGQFIYREGSCGSLAELYSSGAGEAGPCQAEATPVCGASGKNYQGPCEAEAAGENWYQMGACGEHTAQQPNVCPQVYHPVCGGDGNTYSNPCFAEAAGQAGYRVGTCADLDKTPSDPALAACPRNVDPVCASGVTYSNPCEAEAAGHGSFRRGTCSQLSAESSHRPDSGEGAVAQVRKAVGSGELSEHELTSASKENNEERFAMMARELNRGGGYTYQKRPGSNFETCEINFMNDYINSMAEERPGFNVTLYDLQLTLLAFEYVSSGAGVSDLWKVDNIKIEDEVLYPELMEGSAQERPLGGASNIHNSTKRIAHSSRMQRNHIFKAVENKEGQLKCLCYDKNGYDKLSEDQQEYFRTNCPDLYAQYTKLKEEALALGQENIDLQDASGLKYKAMIVAWYGATKELEEDLFVAHTNLSNSMRQLRDWAQTNNWNEVETKKYPLFGFTVKNYTGKVLFGTALVSALLSAGIIAIAGGFAASATISAWVAAGIITASAAAGSLGVWFVGSLKGAWQSSAPMVSDEIVRGRESYKCGKKDECSDFTRVLNQPYNKVCGKHISANACIRSFLVTDNFDGQTRYLIDPWVPHGVSQNIIIKDNREYATLLEQGFSQARSYLMSSRPGQVVAEMDGFSCSDGGGCVPAKEQNVIHEAGVRPESYLQETFVDELGVAQFLPKLRNTENTYRVNDEMMKQVKNEAKKYAINEGFFLETEEQNLEQFADYVWDYHYIFPKVSSTDAISYPTPGLVTYFELVATALDLNSHQNLAGMEGITEVYDLAVVDYDTTLEGLSDGVLIGTSDDGSTTGTEGEGEGDSTGMESLTDVNPSETTNNSASVTTPSNSSSTGGGNTSSPHKSSSGSGNQQNQGGQTSGKSTNPLGGVQTLIGDTDLKRQSDLAKKTLGTSSVDPLSLYKNNPLGSGSLEARNQRLQKALATRQRIDSHKKTQMENFKKHSGDSERGRRILEARQNLMASFLSPTGGSRIAQGETLASVSRGDLRSASVECRGARRDQNRGQDLSQALMTRRSTDSGLGYGTGGGDLSGNRSESVGGDEEITESSATQIDGIVVSSDADRLREAVAERNRRGSSLYERQEGHSLWEIVTNTYIRAYDRLLPKDID